MTIADIARLARQIRCEIEIFVFGGLCVMAEGRCCFHPTPPENHPT